MNASLVDFSNSLADLVERVGASIVCVKEGGRSGVSGTIWRDDLIVTAEHTIRGSRELTIELPAGKSSTATVIGRDPSTDIALLRLSDPVRASAAFTDATELRLGHVVLAVGRREASGLAASHGIISALGGPWRTWHGGRVDQLLRLDLVPFTGFSGGPLVDAQGRVIGVNTSSPRRSVMTIPAATVDRIVDQLLAKGRVAHGYLGVALQPVKLVTNRLSGGTGSGLLVAMVESSSPAEKGGLIVGDIVLTLGAKALTAMSDLRASLDAEQIGKTLQLQVLRGGQTHELSLTVAERPEQ